MHSFRWTDFFSSGYRRSYSDLKVYAGSQVSFHGTGNVVSLTIKAGRESKIRILISLILDELHRLCNSNILPKQSSSPRTVDLRYRSHNINKCSIIDNNTNHHKMSSKKAKAAPTDEELLAQFDDIVESNSNDPKAPQSSDARPLGSAAAPQEEDLLAELNNLAVERPASRPHTPRAASSTNTPAARSSKRNSAVATPPTSSARSSEDKAPEQQSLARKSTESSRSFHKSFTPATEAEPEPEPEKTAAPASESGKQAQSSGGGWWGGIFATASAAVKQAEAAVKEIQKNEEAQRWAEQVKGNVSTLRDLGRSTSIANSIAG